MGLFSFLKNAGSSILKDEAKKNDAEMEMDANMHAMKLSALKSVVSAANLNIADMHIDLEDSTVTVYGQCETTSEKEKVILALGNVSGISAVDDRISIVEAEEAAPEPRFYEVQPGDSLSKIAKKFYGDPMKYHAIFEANQPLLSDPNKIYPGQSLRLPNL